MPVRSIQAGKLNVILPRVGPVDPVIDEVQGEAVGPGDLALHNVAPVGAIHANPANVRLIPPVRPVQIPTQKTRNDVKCGQIPPYIPIL